MKRGTQVQEHLRHLDELSDYLAEISDHLAVIGEVVSDVHKAAVLLQSVLI